MTTTLVDAVLAINYRHQEGGHQWDNVTDYLWWGLISFSKSLGVDGFGLQDVQSIADLRRIAPFRQLPVTENGIGRYSPYHGNSANEVASFALDSEGMRVFSMVPFDQWNKANEAMAVDEIILFANTKARIVAVPYENLIFFYDLTKNEVTMLCEFDPVFRTFLLRIDLSGPVAD